jgi:hypothetical protein
MLIEMKGEPPKEVDALSLASTTTGGEVRLDKAAVVGCASQHKFEAMVITEALLMKPNMQQNVYFTFEAGV